MEQKTLLEILIAILLFIAAELGWIGSRTGRGSTDSTKK